MSSSLRSRWLERLERAQNDPSWQAQAEARVLRFMLARYKGEGSIAPLPPFPLLQGQSPFGLPHLPLTERQIGERLKHIAQIDAERPHDPPSVWDDIAYRDVERHHHQQNRRKRFRTRHERGYW